MTFIGLTVFRTFEDSNVPETHLPIIRSLHALYVHAYIKIGSKYWPRMRQNLGKGNTYRRISASLDKSERANIVVACEPQFERWRLCAVAVPG